MKNKILAMVMAGAMVLSASSVSLAAEQTVAQTDGGKYAAPEIKAEGSYTPPTIKVDLSDTSSKTVAVNPYGLAVDTVNGVSTDADKKAQLVNKTETIENKSEVALAVNATVTATAKGKAKIATAPVVPTTEKANSIFAYLQVEAGATITAGDYNAKDPNKVAFATKPATKKAMVTLDKSTSTGKTASYKILGSVAANPTTPWETEDGADFSIIFDFEPRVLPD